MALLQLYTFFGAKGLVLREESVVLQLNLQVVCSKLLFVQMHQNVFIYHF